MDDAEHDQVPGHQDGQDVQRLAGPDEGENPGEHPEDPDHDEQPPPSGGSAGHHQLGDTPEQEGHAGEGGHHGQAADPVGQHEHAQRGPQDPEDQEPPPDRRHLPDSGPDAVADGIGRPYRTCHYNLLSAARGPDRNVDEPVARLFMSGVRHMVQ
jgi:hypothetical protein